MTHEQLREEFQEFMSERHEQLKGYKDNPFLQMPIALRDSCDKCEVNIRNVVGDAATFFLSKIDAYADVRLEEMVKEVEKIKTDYKNETNDFINGMEAAKSDAAFLIRSAMTNKKEV